MTIVLTWYEVAICAYVGAQRHIQAMSKGRADAHGFSDVDGSGWSKHIEGACGECALAKALNQHWNPSVNTFKRGGDVGNIQVRTRSKQNYDLIVRSDDSSDDTFVLVTGCSPRYEIRGWIYGKDAKRDEYVKAYGGRPSAWFVPVEKLKDMKSMTVSCEEEF